VKAKRDLICVLVKTGDMANNSTCRFLTIYNNNKSLETGAAIFGHYFYLFNLLFNIKSSFFLNPVNGSWRILKLHALHVHRPRSPTVPEWVNPL
jgi:hypothetical protein